jgi:hypothetical protein
VKRHLETGLLVIAVTYWIACIVFAHRAVTGPFNSNELLQPVSSTHGVPSIAVQWSYAQLHRATFFTRGLNKISEADLIAIKVQVESPLGTPIATTCTLRINHDKESLRAEFNPPVKTRGTLGLTLVGAETIPWKYQAVSGNPQVLRAEGGDCLAVQLLPSPMEHRLVNLAAFGALLALFILWVCSKSRLFIPLLFLATTGFMLVVSARSMETRLWLWWGESWPDGYVQQALSLTRWLAGDISYAETGLTSYRNGQTWIVPFVLALLFKTGLQAASAFFFLNVSATFSALALVAAWLRKTATTSLPAAVFLVLAASTLPVLRSAAVLTTDAAAIFALALFTVTFVRLLSGPKSGLNSLAVALSIAIACQIRIAMLPLILVPVSAGLYVLLLSIVDKELNRVSWTRAALIALPALVGMGIIFVTWKALGVLETFQQANAFAHMPEFVSQFHWSDYLRNTAVSTYPLLAVAAVLLVRPKLPAIRRPTVEEMSLLAAALGFLALLAIGKIIPWYRYWAPVAFLCACLTALLSVNQPRWRILALVTLCFVLNGYWLLKNQIL